MTHYPTLTPALTGERRELETSFGRLSYYASVPNNGTSDDPLLLIHSINAAGSAYEVKPIYEQYAKDRPVYALELPGFGFSERRERRYTPRLMTDAILAMVAEMRRLHGDAPFHVLALSLSCEFLARAATESPDAFATLGLVSPTGFNRRAANVGPAGSHRGKPLLYGLFTFPLWTSGFFATLTSRRSIRFFLEKTWGAKEIDEGALDYAWLTTHQPGARFAPYDFVTGFLFSGDIRTIYASLKLPVWMVHGIRGDFVDYSGTAEFARRPHWRIESMPTGALPHFERLDDFIGRYEAFLANKAQAE